VGGDLETQLGALLVKYPVATLIIILCRHDDIEIVVAIRIHQRGRFRGVHNIRGEEVCAVIKVNRPNIGVDGAVVLKRPKISPADHAEERSFRRNHDFHLAVAVDIAGRRHALNAPIGAEILKPFQVAGRVKNGKNGAVFSDHLVNAVAVEVAGH